MKSFMISSIRLFIAIVFLLGCNDRGVDPQQTPPAPTFGKVALSFANTPPEIAQVVATLSRQGYPPRTMALTIHDSTQSASGNFEDVPVGLWHLRIEARDDSAVVRYAGETDINIPAGAPVNVALQLLPTSGGIHITVTWGTPPPPPGELMAYYPLDGNANDMSGNGNNGVVSGAVPTSDRFGHPNSAFFFDGVNDKISISSSPSLHPLRQMTIAFWMRVDSLKTNYLAVIHKGGEAQQQPFLGNREYAVYVLGANVSWYYFQTYSAGDGNGQHVLIQQPPLVVIPQWVFFTAVIDRQNHMMRCYVNGVLNGQTPDSYSSFNVNNYPLTIGSEAETIWTDHSPFFGALDDIRLYKRALTAGEIQSLFNGQ